MQSSYLSARETAERLGIKRDTLYAYVSRGLLRSITVPGSRERGYRPEDVERLRADRGLSRAARSAPLVPIIDSAICLIEDGRLYYRGHDAIRLAETATLEDIADLLWGTGSKTEPAPTRSQLSLRSSLPRSQGRVSHLQAAELDPLPRKRGRVGVGANSGSSIIERCQIRLAELA